MLGKKLITSAAGAAGGGGSLNVEDVFSTYLYEGSGSTQTITNGIDLSGEGGMVWVKDRSLGNTGNGWQMVHDTERGPYRMIHPNQTNSEFNGSSSRGISSFNSDGFTLNEPYHGTISGNDYVSWTWRKAPRFFDIQTWTGNGSNNRAIPHNLGSVPGMVLIKNLDSASTGWLVWHRAYGNSHYGVLNLTQAFATGSSYWPSTFTDTNFYVSNGYSDYWSNGNGARYVAYIFAHNNGDGTFGDTEDQDIIKCGSFTSTSGTDVINLGFEPQWILIKRADAGNSWVIVDELRGNPIAAVGESARYIEPNEYNPESSITGWTSPTPTGFTNSYPLSGATFIYVAIRRAPMATPESGTDVFALDYQSPGEGNDTFIQTGFPVDTTFYSKLGGSPNILGDRLRGKSGGGDLQTNSTDAEANNDGSFFLDHNDGVTVDASGGHFNASPAATDEDYIRYFWRRAPGFFDVASYNGDYSNGFPVRHNLGVAPEMAIFKHIDNGNCDWYVYHKDLGHLKYLTLNSTNPETTHTGNYFYSAPDASNFYLGAASCIQYTSIQSIAYFFGSIDGVSKVGSYTGDGTSDGSKIIDCGFTNGARFVLIKRTNTNGNWFVFDTERGIVSGNEGFLRINTTDAEITTSDSIDPASSGFAVNQDVGSNINVNNHSYIFYAIA